MATITIREPQRSADRAKVGGALLTAGFRPFFLFAAVWGAVAIPIWIAAYANGYATTGSIPPLLWHAHEMVSGFGAAAVAGFLLTAIPNWTGRLPLSGAGLGALAALWLAGRVATLASGLIGPSLTALADLAFPAVFAAVIARELIAGRNYRNLPVLVALTLLLASSALFHAQNAGLAWTAAIGNRLGIATLLLLIALVGGRIIPSFTRNWLVKAGETRLPAAPDGLDRACLAAIATGLAAWVSAPDSTIAPWLEILAGLGAGARLARWRGLSTRREPIVFVLHAGYAWLAAGLFCLGVNGLLEVAAPSVPLHALTVGAIGTMILAVMTRASLGHSGRPLRAGGSTIAVYVLVSAAAVLRIAAGALPTQGPALMWAAGLAWFAAYLLFAFSYGPILVSPRSRA